MRPDALLKYARDFEELVKSPYDDGEYTEISEHIDRDLEPIKLSIYNYSVDEARRLFDEHGLRRKMTGDPDSEDMHDEDESWLSYYDMALLDAIGLALSDDYWKVIPRETMNGPLTHDEAELIQSELEDPHSYYRSL